MLFPDAFFKRYKFDCGTRKGTRVLVLSLKIVRIGTRHRKWELQRRASRKVGAGTLEFFVFNCANLGFPGNLGINPGRCGTSSAWWRSERVCAAAQCAPAALLSNNAWNALTNDDSRPAGRPPPTSCNLWYPITRFNDTKRQPSLFVSSVTRAPGNASDAPLRRLNKLM